MDASLYRIDRPEEICTPALVVFADIARENTEKCIAQAGGADRLWPHMKTHKMAEMLRMQMELGICRFKCATLPEARLAAGVGAQAVILAYPLVGPNPGLFLDLCEEYPGTRFFAIADSREAALLLSEAALARGARANVLADVNLGMDRTGVAVSALRPFLEYLQGLPGLRFSGLHLYDGHIHDEDLAARTARAAAPMEAVFALQREMNGEDWLLVAGGSPTMPCHAREKVFLSPGTVFLWDWGYMTSFPDMPYTPAAAIMTRVVSHPAEGLFTLDCGVKAISCDAAGQRGLIAGMEDAVPVMQNEEHWVWRAPEGRAVPPIGSVFFIIPWHICPAVALYDEAAVVSGGKLQGAWRVAARGRDCLASSPKKP